MATWPASRGARNGFTPGVFGDPEAADVILNAHHQRAVPLARTGGGGLTLADTAEALTFRAELPDTRDAADVMELVRTKVLRGASLEFAAKSERLEGRVRVIRKAELRGLAIVDRPAYSGSTIAAMRDLYGGPGGRETEAPVSRPGRRRLWL